MCMNDELTVILEMMKKFFPIAVWVKYVQLLFARGACLMLSLFTINKGKFTLRGTHVFTLKLYQENSIFENVCRFQVVLKKILPLISNIGHCH